MLYFTSNNCDDADILKQMMVWYGNNLFDITEIHNTLL